MSPAPVTLSGISVIEDESGPPLWSIGFRPFFLLAAVSAVLLVPSWLVLLERGWSTPYFPGKLVHAHEMLFGYTTAVIAGFLLTAGSVWTKQRISSGPALAGLAALWLLGRLGIFLPGLPSWLVALVDISFLPTLAFVLGRTLVATKNRRNYIFIGMLMVLATANALMHLGARGQNEGESIAFAGQTLALRLITLMMLVVGGRVIPMFTRNGTQTPWIAPIAPLEWGAIGGFVVASGLDPVLPDTASGCVWICVGLVNLARLLPWGTWKARPPLLWILHFGMSAVAGSFVLEGLFRFGILPMTAALHLLTVGGIGALTLGIMARVSLGHSGRQLAVPRTMHVSFSLIAAATLVRSFGPWVLPSHLLDWSWISSGVAWTLAYGLFLHFGLPIWLTPRQA